MPVRPQIDKEAADELRQARRDMSASEGRDLTVSEVIRQLVAAWRRGAADLVSGGRRD